MRALRVIALLALLGCTSPQEEHGGFGGTALLSSPSPTPAGSPAPQEGASPELRVSAPGGLRFEPEALRIAAESSVEVVFANEDDQEHTFVVSELALAMLAGPGQTVRTQLEVSPRNRGTFAFYCSVAGHREGGMEGSLTVR